MYNIGANSAVAASELFWILSIVESVVFLLILYWQLLFVSEDFNPFSTATPVLPALIGERRLWFARRQRLYKLLQLWTGFNYRYLLFPAHSDFLLLRDGPSRAGYFKTPARSDIPPPCWA
jgi:hypothetical protein